MLHNEAKTYLENLDREQKALASYNDEHQIAESIIDILAKDTNYQRSIEDMAEQTAFDFMAEYPNDYFGWGTYYGPMSVLPNRQGRMMEYPSIKKVNEEILNYWAKRARETKNPILSSRYADLVVDFSPKVLNQDADDDLFRVVIDSNLTICDNSLADPLDCITKIERALALAVDKGDQERMKKVTKTITDLEERIAKDDKPGTWGFAFKGLILDFGKKITLDETEKAELIKSLEDRLKRVEKDVWLTKCAVYLLAEYYANEKDEDNLMRVLNILEKSLKTDEHTNSDSLLKLHAYKTVYEIYQKYRDKGFPRVEAAGNRISQEIG